MSGLEKKDGWNPEGYPDSKERCHKMLLGHMKDLGLGNGERGWIEHSDESGNLVRDEFSFEGELLFAFASIEGLIAELKEKELAVHRKLAAAELDASLSWSRYRAENEKLKTIEAELLKLKGYV